MLLVVRSGRADPAPALDVRAACESRHRGRQGSLRVCWASRCRRRDAARDALGVVVAPMTAVPFGADATALALPDGRIFVVCRRRERPADPRGARAERGDRRCRDWRWFASRPVCRRSRPPPPICSFRRPRTGTCLAASISRRAAIPARKSSRGCNISGGSRSGSSHSGPKRRTSRRRRGCFRRRLAASRRAAPSSTRRPIRRRKRAAGGRAAGAVDANDVRLACARGPLLVRRSLPYAVPDAPRAARAANSVTRRADADVPRRHRARRAPALCRCRRGQPGRIPRAAGANARTGGPTTEGFALLAGRDLRQGGTWLGVNRLDAGRSSPTFANPGRHDADAPSRGALVPRCCATRATSTTPSRRSSRRVRPTTASTSPAAKERGRRSPPTVRRTRDHWPRASTAFRTRSSIRRGRSSRAPRRASPRGRRWAATISMRSSRFSPTARSRTTTHCPIRASRASASGCCRRRSS